MVTTIDEMRIALEQQYVGFEPSRTSSVKPVHIANGLFRVALDETLAAKLLHQFVFSETKDGVVPRGHELETVYEALREQEKIDTESISKENLPIFRKMLKMIVGADGAVFNGTMVSYSAGFRGFLTRDTIAQRVF